MNVRSIQSEIVALVSPRRFWTEQIQYYENQIAAIEGEPESAHTEKLRVQSEIAQKTAQVKNSRPDLFTDQGSPEQKSVDDLRKMADRIENSVILREAEAQRQQRLALSKRCRSVALAKLGAL